MDCSNNALTILTRSSAELGDDGKGLAKVWYVNGLPAKGTPVNIVLQVTLGVSGHINVWIDGSQVADADTPVGYYLDGEPLCYPHFGLYVRNQPTTDVVYIANPEIGTADISARIDSPILIPTLDR